MKRARFEKEYRLRMQKSPENKQNSTSFVTRPNSKIEYNFPDVTIDNLNCLEESVDEATKTEAPTTTKNAILAFSNEYPRKRKHSNSKFDNK